MPRNDVVSGPHVPDEKRGGPQPGAVGVEEVDPGSVARNAGEAVVSEREGDGEPVALTRLRIRGSVDEAAVERAVDAWRDCLDAAGVVGFVDWSLDDDGLTVVTEAMDGGSLAGRLADPDDVIWPDEAVWIADRIADPLATAHDRGEYHLALDPETVWFDGTDAGTWDRPNVAGWGIRRTLRDAGAGVGDWRPAYAAPEQLSPDRFGDPDARTDVYRLGAVLYELLAGRPPRTGTGYEALGGSVTGAEIVPPSDAAGIVPDTLDDVVLTALATDPDDRYDSVAALREALADLDLSASVRAAAAVEEYCQYAGGPANRGRTTGGDRSPDGAGDPEDDPEVTVDWQTRLGAAVGDPAVAYGTVYVGDEEGTLAALRADTGDVRWKRPLEAYVEDADHRRDDVATAPPAVGEGTVVAAAGGRIVAFDALDGSIRWRRDLTLLAGNALTVADGLAFAVVGDDTLSAIDVQSGETAWTATLSGDAGGGQRVAPAVADGLVVVNTDEGVETVDADTGDRRWEFPTYFARPPSVASGRVYVGDEDAVYALDAADGTTRWRDDLTYGVAGPPAVGDDAVYVTVDDEYGGVRALDPDTGERRWHYDLEAADREREPTGNAVRTGDLVVLPLSTTLAAREDTEELLGLDAADGTVLWRYDAGERGHGAPVPVDDRVVIGTEESDVTGLSVPTARAARAPAETDDTGDDAEADATDADEPADSTPDAGTTADEGTADDQLRQDAETLKRVLEAEPDNQLDKDWVPDETGWSPDRAESVLDRLEDMGVVHVDDWDDVTMVRDPQEAFRDDGGTDPDDNDGTDDQLRQDAETLKRVLEAEPDNQLDKDWVPDETGWSPDRAESVLDRLEEMGVVHIDDWDDVTMVRDPEDAFDDG